MLPKKLSCNLLLSLVFLVVLSLTNGAALATGKGSAGLATAAPGDLDPMFGSGGPTVFDFEGHDNFADSLKVLPNDRILVMGGAPYRGAMFIQSHPDGALDTSFAGSGILFPGLALYDFFAVQADGKILTAGPGALYRFTGAGVLDSAFGAAGKVTTPFNASDMVVQADGKIIITGSADHEDDFDIFFARYNTDGSIDTSFGSAGVATTNFSGYRTCWLGELAVQQDGKILREVCLFKDLVNPVEEKYLLRYNSDGSLDTDFSGDAVAVLDMTINSIKFQGDGKILIAGSDDLERYNSSGTLDTGFGVNGKIPLASVTSFWVQPDGKILVLAAGGLTRYNSNGILDISYGEQGTMALQCGASAFQRSNVLDFLSTGQIITVLNTIDPDFYMDYQLQRCNADGSADLTFNSHQVDMVAAAALQPDGKIVSVDRSFSFDRRNIDGSLDTSFGQSGTTSIEGMGSGAAVAIQPDGKIVAAGTNSSTSNYDLTLVRLNSNGSLDTSFSGDGKVTTGVQLHDRAHAVVIQSDGKIIVAGETDTGNLDWNLLLVRYNSNGSPDTGFGTNGVVITNFGYGEAVHGLSIQPDGKIIASGIIGTSFGVARYNPNGSLDTGFGEGGRAMTSFSGGNNNGCANAVQPDGKILVGGYAEDTFALARYTTNGTLDTSFGEDGKVITDFGGLRGNALALRADGKIVLAGGGDGLYGVAQYNPDGSLDTQVSEDGKMAAYLNGSGSSASIAHSVMVQPDGKIVIAGDYGLVRFISTGIDDGMSDIYLPVVLR